MRKILITCHHCIDLTVNFFLTFSKSKSASFIYYKIPKRLKKNKIRKLFPNQNSQLYFKSIVNTDLLVLVGGDSDEAGLLEDVGAEGGVWQLKDVTGAHQVEPRLVLVHRVQDRLDLGLFYLIINASLSRHYLFTTWWIIIFAMTLTLKQVFTLTLPCKNL